jgi:hypothetical protein
MLNLAQNIAASPDETMPRNKRRQLENRQAILAHPKLS